MSAPTLDVQFEEIQKFVSWCCKCSVTLGRSAGPVKRKANTVWGELDVMAIAEVDITETDFKNIDSGDADAPRQEVVISQIPIRMQLSIFSRSQKPGSSAWYTAMNARIRMSSPWAASKWLGPSNIALVDIRSISDKPRNFDNRIEDIAIFELLFYIVVTDADAAARGTWIEHVEISTDIQTMAEGLQLDEEEMP